MKEFVLCIYANEERGKRLRILIYYTLSTNAFLWVYITMFLFKSHINVS